MEVNLFCFGFTRGFNLLIFTTGTSKVECIREDGVGRVLLTDSAPYPFGLSYHGNNIFWTDWSQ